MQGEVLVLGTTLQRTHGSYEEMVRAELDKD